MNAWRMIKRCAKHQPRRDPPNIVLTETEYRQVRETLQPYSWRLTFIPEESMGDPDVIQIGGEPVSMVFEGVPT